MAVDLSSIRLPSDRITFGQMRASQPEVFRRERLLTERASEVDVCSIFMLEECLAQRAYAAAIGQQPPHFPALADHREMIEMLDDAYREYGLSGGLEETKQFVRGIEIAAVAQAKKAIGKSR
ncbi:MAG TPA: hypothetical protein VGN12_16520 [Pirellulales bacterium]